LAGDWPITSFINYLFRFSALLERANRRILLLSQLFKEREERSAYHVLTN